MNSDPPSEISCVLCSKPVDLQMDLSADENGKAVHTDCYVKHITASGSSSHGTIAAD
jgi:hypothetical protein